LLQWLRSECLQSGDMGMLRALDRLMVYEKL